MNSSTTSLKKRRIQYEFKNDKPMLTALYLLFLLLGLTLVIIAFKYFKESIDLLRNGINTEATVTKIIELNDSDGKTYTALFSFKDRDGNIVSFQNPVASNPIVWKRGEDVSIVYDPTTPTNAKVVSYWGLFRSTIVILMIASPLLVLSVGYFVFLSFASSFRILSNL
jgi:hypothetical protein